MPKKEKKQKDKGTIKYKPFYVKKIPELHHHPDPPIPQMPRHEFTMYLVAPPGCGKTNTGINLLDGYAGYFHDIRIISPTINSDEKWDYVKDRKYLAENKELKAWIKKMQKESDTDKIMPGQKPGSELNALVDDAAFTGFIPKEHFYDDLDEAEAEFRLIMAEQKETINILKKYGQPKTMANRLLIILDDQVGSKLLKSHYFAGVMTRHRHHAASVVIMSQAYKEVAKTIRTLMMCLIVFRIGNEREVFVIYEEWAMGLPIKAWLELYNHATEGEHDFLFLDRKKPRGHQVWKNFENEIAYHEEAHDEASVLKTAGVPDENTPPGNK